MSIAQIMQDELAQVKIQQQHVDLMLQYHNDERERLAERRRYYERMLRIEASETEGELDQAENDEDAAEGGTEDGVDPAQEAGEEANDPEEDRMSVDGDNAGEVEDAIEAERDYSTEHDPSETGSTHGVDNTASASDASAALPQRRTRANTAAAGIHIGPQRRFVAGKWYKPVPGTDGSRFEEDVQNFEGRFGYVLSFTSAELDDMDAAS